MFMDSSGNIVVVESDPEIIKVVRAQRARAGNRTVTVLDNPSTVIQLARYDHAVSVLFGLAQFKSFGRRISKQFDEIREITKIILVLREAELMEALDYVDWCDGFLFIDRQPERLNEIIDLAVHGYCIFPTSLLSVLVSHHLRLDIMPTLSKNEINVLTLLGRGLTNRVIAQGLGFRDSTVKNYVRSILKKMHFRNRTEAGIFAFRHLLAKASEEAREEPLASYNNG